LSQAIDALTAALLCALATIAAVAQDPTKVDANHNKVTFEFDLPDGNLRKSA
jgi:hypothetical protein